jgi:hypothetical protein
MPATTIGNISCHDFHRVHLWIVDLLFQRAEGDLVPSLRILLARKIKPPGTFLGTYSEDTFQRQMEQGDTGLAAGLLAMA